MTVELTLNDNWSQDLIKDDIVLSRVDGMKKDDFVNLLLSVGVPLEDSHINTFKGTRMTKPRFLQCLAQEGVIVLNTISFVLLEDGDKVQSVKINCIKTLEGYPVNRFTKGRTYRAFVSKTGDLMLLNEQGNMHTISSDRNRVWTRENFFSEYFSIVSEDSKVMVAK